MRGIHGKKLLEHLRLKRRKTDGTSAPDQRVGSNAARLKSLLRQRGIDLQWVNAAVIFSQYSPLDFTHTAERTEVWQSADVDNNLVRVAASTPQTNNQVERVAQMIQALSGEQ